jgi:Peptidase family S41
MNRRSFLSTASAALAMPTVTLGQPATPADLKGDIAILREALALHPGLYRYTDPRAMSARIDQLEGAFAAAPDLDTRYLLLSRFLATIRCGHSYANFYNQKKSLAAALFDRRTRVPFHFVWVGDSMVVTADHSSTGKLPPGTRITRIDGATPAVIRNALMPYTRADGHNDLKRIAQLEVQGFDRFETFDVFQGLLFPPRADGYPVEAIQPGGSRISIDLPAIDLAARRAVMPRKPVRDGDPLWTWTMRSDAIAVLTMPDWGTYDSKWDWKAWLDERLAGLSGAKGLVVDIRDNEGGEDCGDPILARLAQTDLVEAGAEQKLRFQRTPAHLDRFLDTWDDSFRTLGAGGRPLPGGFYERPGADTVLTIPAKGPRLTLPVAILTSATNSSATFQFAMRAKRNGLARLYGGTTGGNRRGINGGCFFFVRLPASGIEFDLPLVGYFPAGTQPDAGLVPDVPVARSVQDIAAGRDPVITRAVADILRA